MKKVGAPIRRGFEYQDLSALRIALEYYIAHKQFEIHLEYGKIKGLDDIVVFCDSEIDAFQIRHTENPLKPYTLDDLTKSDSRTNFEKFASGWLRLKELFPMHEIRCHLLSNRSLDSTFDRIVSSNGQFVTEFVDNRIRKTPRQFRMNLMPVTRLTEVDFKEFLRAFRFDLNQPLLPKLEEHIRGTLLDHGLGISTPGVFYDLLQEIRRHTTGLDEPITNEIFDRVLRETERRYILPQVFGVDQESFVTMDTLNDVLDMSLDEADGEYVVVTGLPGSGKSTSLSVYLDILQQTTKFEVVRYYCFVRLNDNKQKRRIEAQSLRTNILAELNRKFPDVLKRKFDFSDKNLDDALTAIGEHLQVQGRKLIVFVDGLDHAERDNEVLDNVLAALPATVSKGVVFLIGTQDLRHWKPLTLKMGRQTRHIPMPLFSLKESNSFLEKQGITLDEQASLKVHQKSEGLPLYLKYLVQQIHENGLGSVDLNALPPAKGGLINTYYEVLWSSFEQEGHGNAKHLCATLACLNFKVHSDELHEFQYELTRPEYDEAYQALKHLLRNEQQMVSLFHNSFRVFVQAQITHDYMLAVQKAITSRLLNEEGSSRWYRFVFDYAFTVGNYEYILRHINKEFVDVALTRLRPRNEIFENTQLAIETAMKNESLVELARLGPLKYRTNERFEHLDNSTLAEALLHLGRKEEVVHFFFDSETNEQLVSDDAILDFINACTEAGERELGNKLFRTIRNSFQPSEHLQHEMITTLGATLGIYGTNKGINLRWLSQFTLSPELAFRRDDQFAPGYSPHLECFLSSQIKHRDGSSVKSLKRMSLLFPNQLVRYYIIRILAKQGDRNNLAREILEYVKLYPGLNIELASLAAQSGLSTGTVRQLAGTLSNPPGEPPDLSIGPYYTREFRKYRLNATVLAYEGSESALSLIDRELSNNTTYWKSLALFSAKCGACIGKLLASKTEGWYSDAAATIDLLIAAAPSEGERIFEIHDGIRDYLPEAIFDLTQGVITVAPNRIGEWMHKLNTLRDSQIWHIHYGISEYSEDFSFELKIWSSIASLPQVRPHLYDIIVACEQTYLTRLSIKGGSRCQHLASLATLAARCGFRSLSESLILKSVIASNIYGYHKDVTLSNLMDVAKVVNHLMPKDSLKRCADILEMIKWMGRLTDGRETKWFPQQGFSVVLQASRSAALDLIAFYSKHTARWKMLDCVEQYVCSRSDGDVEFLWALSELFAAHFSELGRHPKEVIKARQHIVQLSSEVQSDQRLLLWEERLERFIRTSISPNQWPNELWVKITAIENRPMQDKKHESEQELSKLKDSYLLDGRETPVADIKAICFRSFSDFVAVTNRLKAENEFYGDPPFTNEILDHHIRNASGLVELEQLKTSLVSEVFRVNALLAEKLAHRFLESNNIDAACDCLEKAHESAESWTFLAHEAPFGYLQKIKRYDIKRVKRFLLKKCYDNLQPSYGGFALPAYVAMGLDIMEDTDGVEQVYNDYLQHCRELFSHLPEEEVYGWLRDYGSTEKNENSQIFSLLLDEVSNLEVDLGKRLMHRIVSLARVRSKLTWPTIISECATSDNLKKTRLLSVIASISYSMPELVRQSWESVRKLGEESHFMHKLMSMRILESAFKEQSLPLELERWIQEVMREYSSTISVSTYRLLKVSPSAEFVEFLRKGTLYDFERQLKAIAEVLHMDHESIISDLEQRLNREGWTLAKGKEDRKEDWDGQVHPQGWPVVWIVPRFHTQMLTVLYLALDEYFVKMKFKPCQLEAIWRIIQPSDPEYILHKVQVKPNDIAPLIVTDKDAWLNELTKREVITTKPLPNDGWVTLFEQRVLSQDSAYEVPYVETCSVHSTLINPYHALTEEQIQENAIWFEPIIVGHPDETLTWEQAKVRLLEESSETIPLGVPSIPIIASKRNSPSFVGFRIVGSLASLVIRDLKLSFDGFDLYRQRNQVTRVQYWQEGYIDESYTRDLLSHGVRFQIKVEYLQEIINMYGLHLCIEKEEERQYYKSKHHREASEKTNGKQIEIFI